jgi:ATP-dependent RNA helicase SUPV3L1/SUV3
MPISFSSVTSRDPVARGHGVTAVLGPTNTGKTHLAIERMLAHSTGIIGLPLRLLAREVYNKAVERVGADAVALVTGEEKIKPPNPRFWVATVEAMPRDLDVSFVAIDEIQLGVDLERGHVFTDRMLNRRGRDETLVLGAATMRPMVEKLLPGANILSRPRLSQLTFAGEKKLTRQPRRTAIVAFSADEVYAIAELIRRQRGGAAVVLGALSPRTRNAQVALYQSGDVDYLVATDAIGMGLNLDVDHVAFASDRKFDGYQFRQLNPAELAQIAGRAGRAMRDGTFGTTGRCAPFEPDLVQALESHSFENVKILQWRNTDLDFSSTGALAASLATAPTLAGLTRAPTAEDILVLDHASRDDDVRALATTRDAVERLWEVCQVPDYRKLSPAAHSELVVALYGFLARKGRIPDDWFADQVAQADRTDGDIDTLSQRIAHIRTWTFAANRPDWLTDPDHWQGVTRAVEDKLSDALHERLTERFVDRRTSVLMRRLRENTMLETEITKTGEVVVEGHAIGRLDGFRFAPDATTGGTDAKALGAAAQKALAGEIEARATRLSQAPDSQLVLAAGGTIRWIGEAVAKLTAGDNVLRPRVRILSDEHLTGAALEHVQTRLDLWTRTHIERLLAPLFVLGAADDVTGLARGIAFQVVESLGVLERSKVAEDVKSLDQAARAVLRKHGVRFGAFHIYVPALLKPGPRALAAELWALKHGGPEVKGLDEVQRLAASGRTSFAADKETPKALYRASGYRVCGERAVRVDILERLADLIRPALAWREGSAGEKPAGAVDGRSFMVTQAMTSLTGSSGEDFASILRALGYRMEKRPKPPEPAPVAPPAETPAPAEASAAEAVPSASVAAEPSEPSEPSSAAEGQQEQEGQEEQEGQQEPIAAEAAPAPEAAAAPAAGEAVPDAAVEQCMAAEAASEPVVQIAAETEAPVAAADAAASASAASATAAAEPTASAQSAGSGAAATTETVSAEVISAELAPALVAEPQFIEVWRPGGRSDERRGPRRHGRPPRRPHGEAAPSTAPALAVSEQAAASPEGAAAEGSPAPAAPDGERRGRRHGRGDRERRDDRPERREARRPDRDRGDRRERFDRSERRERRPDRRSDRGEENRIFATTEKGPRERGGRDPDPNSPFAKLAALKAQLEANEKEKR